MALVSALSIEACSQLLNIRINKMAVIESLIKNIGPVSNPAGSPVVPVSRSKKRFLTAILTRRK